MARRERHGRINHLVPHLTQRLAGAPRQSVVDQQLQARSIDQRRRAGRLDVELEIEHVQRHLQASVHDAPPTGRADCEDRPAVAHSDHVGHARCWPFARRDRVGESRPWVEQVHVVVEQHAGPGHRHR